MDNLGRLVLRFLLVPLGYLIAVLAGTFVLIVGAWKLVPITSGSEADAAPAIFGALFAAPILLVVLLGVMWVPASIGILLSEALAIRSWVFHAGNGAVAAWMGWGLFGFIDDSRISLHEPATVIAAGLAGGLAYWAIAGSSAGFWRPVFRAGRPAAFAAGPEPPQIRSH